MSKKRSGFTLIEIMIVVVIIGLLAAMVGPRLAGKSEMAKIETAKSSMATIASMVEMYYLKTPTATTAPDASALGSAGLGKVPKDSWGKDFAISGTQAAWTITCTTADGKTLTYTSGTGDITGPS